MNGTNHNLRLNAVEKQFGTAKKETFHIAKNMHFTLGMIVFSFRSLVFSANDLIRSVVL